MKQKIIFIIAAILMVFAFLFGCKSPRVPPTIAPVPAAPTSTPAYSFGGAMGRGGTCAGINAPDQLMTPCGIAINSNNDAYLADVGNHRIIRYDAAGNTLQIVGGASCSDFGSNAGQFRYPHGVALDSDNNVYVLDTGNKRVQKFDSSMNFIKQFGVFSYPTGIAADKMGSIYVADSENNVIQKFDLNGNFITEWSNPGNAAGQFYKPAQVAVNNAGSMVYVTDYMNHKVLKFTSNGVFVKEWGGYTAGTSMYPGPHDDGPWGIAVDKDGYIYVTDPPKNLIYKYDADGQYIMEWTVYNAPYYGWPWAIAVDYDGDVYAVCYNSKVIKFKY